MVNTKIDSDVANELSTQIRVEGSSGLGALQPAKIFELVKQAHATRKEKPVLPFVVTSAVPRVVKRQSLLTSFFTPGANPIAASADIPDLGSPTNTQPVGGIQIETDGS